MLDVKKYTLLTFKGICMNFLLQLSFFLILNHPVSSKQPHCSNLILFVQIHVRHPVNMYIYFFHYLEALFALYNGTVLTLGLLELFELLVSAAVIMVGSFSKIV